MSDVAALLLNCLRNPHDDAARLVLADALQEHGDADRAEFVRLQVRGRSPGDDWQPDEAVTTVRALRLYKQHVHEWFGGYLTNRYWFSFDPDADEEADGAKGKLERGTLLLAGEPDELQEALDRLPRGAADWLECLQLGDWDDRTAVRSLLNRAEVRNCSSLSVSWEDEPPLDAVDLLDRDGLRDLTVGQNEQCGALLARLAGASRLRPHKLTLPADPSDSRGCAELLASPVLSELRDLELDLEGNHHPIRLLAAARHVHRLDRLYISGDDFPAGDLRELFQSPVARTLTDLSISGYSGNLRDVVLGLAGETALRQLRRLDLGFNEVTTPDGEALAASAAIESLTHLTFSSGTVTDGGLRALVTSPLLGPLEHLDLSCTGITDAAVAELAGSPKLRGLRYLSLCRCAVTARGVRALAESPHLSGLEYLDIGLNPLEPTALNALASSARLGNLRGLRLSRLTIAAGTLARLVDSPVMRQVQKLDMSDVTLGTDHVRALAAAREFASLREFSLYGARGKAGTFAPLMDAPWLDQLAELNLTGMKLDDECVRRLTRTLRSGNVGILHLENNAITSRGADVLLNWTDLPALGELGLYGNAIPPDRESRIARVVLRPKR